MKTIIVIITCFFLTLSFATDTYAAKGPKFKISCKICKEISEFVGTKLREGFEFIQTKVSNAFFWIEEKTGWGFLSHGAGRGLGKSMAYVCNEYELCCTEPLDNFCQDLSEELDTLEFCRKIGDKIGLEKIESCQQDLNNNEAIEDFFEDAISIDKNLFDN